MSKYPGPYTSKYTTQGTLRKTKAMLKKGRAERKKKKQEEDKARDRCYCWVLQMEWADPNFFERCCMCEETVRAGIPIPFVGIVCEGCQSEGREHLERRYARSAYGHAPGYSDRQYHGGQFHSAEW